MRKICLMIACATLFACGGGGGDDSGDDAKFIGVWDLDLSQTSNNCRADLTQPADINPRYEINQLGNSIAARNMNSNATLEGQTTNNGNAFVATNSTQFAPGCFATVTLGFNAGDSDSALATMRLAYKCSNENECAQEWSGLAFKQ